MIFLIYLNDIFIIQRYSEFCNFEFLISDALYALIMQLDIKMKVRLYDVFALTEFS